MLVPPSLLQVIEEAEHKTPGSARRLAQGWMLMGGAVAIVAFAIAVAYFGYGVVLRSKHSGRQISPVEIGLALAIIGGIGAAFAVMGASVRRWADARR